MLPKEIVLGPQPSAQEAVFRETLQNYESELRGIGVAK